ncbi:hypothetical protein TCAL_07506 [Tigriopus californicus]|uniref:Uncharacterized protein n=1 Tax=Tigriopus californicus TaxID=6832 RepID=A0A553PD50_TIGCA|nr:hypothetical protein TCAL_07506 [Tigriopus californicus]
MSGELAARKRKGKKNPVSSQSLNGHDNAGNEVSKGGSSRRYVDKSDSGSRGAGCCVKTLFYMLLSTVIVIGFVIYVEYKPGQLNDAYVLNVPLEYRLKIRDASTIVGQQVQAQWNIFKEGYDQGNRVLREQVKGLIIGNVDVEYLL